MTSLRWLPGRSLAGHIITRPSADPRRINYRMLRHAGLGRDPMSATFGAREIVATG